MSGHTIPHSFEVGGSMCLGHFSYSDNVEAVVVFVHGLGGDAVTTWLDFNCLLPLDKRAEPYDLIFFGYDSLYSPTENSAFVLYEFLARLCTNPALPALPRYQRPQYKRVVLVAHSLGAIICRKALLMEATRSQCTGADLRLVLVAPADRANATDLAKTLEGPLATVYSGLRWIAPSIQDLDAGELATLKESVCKSVTAHTFLAATRVINAHRDRYVKPQRYCQDPHYPDLGAKDILGADHSSVCKPKAASAAQYVAIAEVL